MGLSLTQENRRGSHEWIFQRVSNIAIILWAVIYLGLILSLNELTYETWSNLHTAGWFKIYSTFTLVLTMFNSLLAGWQIGTDYTQKVPFAWFEKAYSAFYISVTVVYLVAGLYILWF